MQIVFKIRKTLFTIVLFSFFIYFYFKSNLLKQILRLKSTKMIEILLIFKYVSHDDFNIKLIFVFVFYSYTKMNEFIDLIIIQTRYK
jgi:hypothetical protein